MAVLSVIVPIYNTRDYLKKCIESILNQTFKDMELILVDDGSTDGSAEVCQNYVKADKRVKYVYQENAGELVSRQTGTNVANGKYIAFVDSDDYIDEDYYEKMMKIALEYDVDLVESDHFVYNEKNIGRLKKGYYHSHDDMKYIKENMMFFEDVNKEGIHRSNCTKVFKKEKICKTFFDYHSFNKRLNIGGDAVITFMYVLDCDSVYISDVCGYHYDIRNGSALHSIHKKFLENISNFYTILEKTFKKSNQNDVLIDKLEKLINNFILNAPKFMGFSINNQFQRYTYSIKFDSDSKIALYGAGIVGKDYYKSMAKENKLPIVWVDSNYANIKEFAVKPVSELKNVDFDYIVIAVLYENVADEIKKNLINMGISAEKILWKEPVCIEY